jgi:hypothetical protein
MFSEFSKQQMDALREAQPLVETANKIVAHAGLPALASNVGELTSALSVAVEILRRIVRQRE